MESRKLIEIRMDGFENEWLLKLWKLRGYTFCE
jgi:hypothetical protein